MAQVYETVKREFDTESRVTTIDFDSDEVDRQEFQREAIPYVVGWASSAGYGVTNIDYMRKRITCTRVQTDE